jgi:propanediol dehydratase small subunit
MPKFNESQWESIAAHLRVAADQYAKDAEIARNMGHQRVAEQFDRQIREALDLADAIDGGDAEDDDK